MRTLVLLAHGSRNPTACREVAELAKVVGRRIPDTRVMHAFLDMEPPTLPEVLESVVGTGKERVDILPLFLNTGNHVERDIPNMIEQARRRHPSATIRLLRHIGSHPGYPALVQEMAADAERFVMEP